MVVNPATPDPARCRTTNWPSYNASIKLCNNLLVWFNPDMEWFAASGRKLGYPIVF